MWVVRVAAATAARKAADLSLTLLPRRRIVLSRRGDGAKRRARGGRLAIALHTRQLAADIDLMLALGGGRAAPPEPRAKSGFAPYYAD